LEEVDSEKFEAGEDKVREKFVYIKLGDIVHSKPNKRR
jgi:hypothetical protein